jgi:uncharacterized membrane protein
MFLKLYLLSVPVFFLIDMVWLGLVARNFYKDQIGHLMASSVNWLAAIIFYLLFLLGLIYFVIAPNYASGDVNKLILSALFFGLVTYATYDLTNLATLKNWPVVVTVVDMAWGAILAALVSIIVYFLAKQFGV